MAARLVTDRYRHASQIGRRFDLGISAHKNARWRDRIGIGEQLGVAARRRDVDRPVAGAGDVGLAPLLDALKRPALSCCGVVGTVGGANELVELVIETLGAKVPL